MEDYLKTKFIVYSDRSSDYEDEPKKMVCLCQSDEDYEKNFTTEVLYTISGYNTSGHILPNGEKADVNTKPIKEEYFNLYYGYDDNIDIKMNLVKEGYCDCLNIDLNSLSNPYNYDSYLNLSINNNINNKDKILNSSTVCGIIFLNREVGHKYHEISIKKKYEKKYLLSVNRILIDKDYNPSVTNFFNPFETLLISDNVSKFNDKFLYDSRDKAIENLNYILDKCADLFDYKMKAGPDEYYKSDVINQNLNIVIDLVESLYLEVKDNKYILPVNTDNPFKVRNTSVNPLVRNSITISEFIKPIEGDKDE